MTGNIKYLLASALLLAIAVPSIAVAVGEGDPIQGGVRNPQPDPRQELTRETQIITENATYGTRQSNKSNNGGGAIYGCRSAAGGTAANNEPCIRANNLSNGRAFEFNSSTGNVVGEITVGTGGDDKKPFTTNATGVATGLNADRVDGFDGSTIAPRFASVTAAGTLAGGRGATAAAKPGVGNYTVTFADNISACVYQATQINQDAGAAGVEPIDAQNLRVRTRDGADANPYADRAFHLAVHC